MAQYFFSYNGQQMGPLELTQAIAQAAANPNGYVWREGFQAWLPITETGELGRGVAISSGGRPAGRQTADEIDYKIIGAEMQFVEIELDPGESVVAEAGAMMYKDATIQMESIFGDGSHSGDSSFVGKLLGAGRRILTGESLFITAFTHSGSGKARIAFAAPYPGNIIPVPLPNVGGHLICQKDSFLCAAKGVSIGIFFQKKILTALFGGEGFVMQKLEGDGLVFVHAGGTIVERQLAAGETLHVDTGCIVAMEPSVHFDVQRAGNIKTMLFGGEGLFMATLQGPGKVWLQSLPFSRLAGRMLSGRASGKDQGSVLGGLGDLFGDSGR